MAARSHKQTLSIPQQKRNLAHRDASGGAVHSINCGRFAAQTGDIDENHAFGR
jgi:hypothetical protein